AAEDEGVHQSWHGLLEELALPEHLGELTACPRGRLIRTRGRTCRAQDLHARAGAPPEQHGRGRDQRDQRDGAQDVRRRRISSVRAGSSWKRTPTTPRSAMPMIVASASVLIATIRRAPFIPTACCRAPLIPAARDTSGLTVLPVCPIW